MTAMEIVNLVVVIVVAYLAFRIGAVLMKVLLGLVAIGLLVWLILGLVNGTDVVASLTIVARRV